MGLGIRSKNLLNFNFPSIVWKPLVNDVVTEADVAAIDNLAWNPLEGIKQAESSMKPEMFDEAMEEIKFEVNGSDGKLRPLIDGGDQVSLSWKNRKKFIDLIRKYRLNEFTAQCQAMRRGLATVVPQALLSIFTWRELEVAVCGRGMTIEDVAMLERLTNYSGCSASDPHIKLFWQMMREKFTEEERGKFLVYVWGRSRLPTVESDFGQTFRINDYSRSKGKPDDWFPIGHTCGFSIDFPRYTSIEMMTKRVLWAINASGEIDADGGGGGGTNYYQSSNDNEDDGEESLF